jgi:hypothetical protein
VVESELEGPFDYRGENIFGTRIIGDQQPLNNPPYTRSTSLCIAECKDPN